MLLTRFLALLSLWRPVFQQERSFQRAVRQAVGALLVVGSEAAMDKFHATTEDLLDLSKSVDAVSAVYNEQLRLVIRRFRDAYGTLATRLPNLELSYYYATRGDVPHPNVTRKVDRLESQVKRLFSSVNFNFTFIGASNPMELLRRQPSTTVLTKMSSLNRIHHFGEAK